MPKRLIFLLGGARSGKSRYAEAWARTHGARVLFVATAQAGDADMAARIAEHRARRPGHWQSLEAPRQVPQRIRDCAIPHDVLLLDCITLMTSNLLLDLPESTSQIDANEAILSEVEALLAVYERSEATWMVVSNEVGMGVVPPSRLGVLFRDMLGRANQRVAERADEVILLVAGLSWKLK
ncbi:MAG: bifunctional adenosylcobinamide kinase/adenosylcobinamide-phosphate guanylyltransferase [Chloroflexi bacterium]|nr:bifunctional adenosylcobinamide kinase/adenosylcobinamide-phosphate guanylyltransferase [Chloroflexota bacterium]